MSPSSEKEVEKRVREFTPLVKRMAQLKMAAVPASVEVDDMIQCGMMGLLDAARRYEAVDGAQFETYAAQRIRGAMLDELRQCDWLPREVRRRLREVEKTISRLEQQNGRAPAEAEIADALDMTVGDYQQLLHEARGYQIVSYDDFSANEEDAFLERYAVTEELDPLKMLEERGVREAVVAGIDGLPDREKKAMALYYEHNFTLREIGEVLGVSESRVCQLHTQAVARLRTKMAEAF